MVANKIVFNNKNSPLYVVGTDNPNNPIVITDKGAGYAANGMFYTITTGAVNTGLLTSGFLVLEIKNPANSNKTLYVSQIQGGANSQASINAYKNANIGSGTPTNLAPKNTNYSSANVSSMKARFLMSTSDPTNGGTLFFSTIQASGSFSFIFNGEIIIPSTVSDQYIYFRYSTASVNTNMSLSFSWWEV